MTDQIRYIPIYAVLALGKHFTDMQRVLMESRDVNQCVARANEERATGKWLWVKTETLRYHVERDT